MNPPDTDDDLPRSLERPKVLTALQEYRTALGAGLTFDHQSLLDQFPDAAEDMAGCLKILDFLDSAVAEVSTELLSSRDPVLPIPLGDYLLVREVGRGGMGVVYEAEQ